MVRMPAVAGMFYPSDPVTLRAEVERFLASRHEPAPGPHLALVSPHAGYPYSGAVAGAAWARVRGQAPDLTVFLGPSHRVPFQGFALPESQIWETPLGQLALDRDALRVMEDAPCVVWEEPHIDEHSIEVQLPFYQVALPKAGTVLPIVCGRCTPAEIAGMAEALAGLYRMRDGRVLFVCSTDLSHDFRYDEACVMDARTASALADCDADRLAALFSSRQAEACGMVGLQVVVRLARHLGRSGAEVTGLTNSGDVIGNRQSRIVGYLSAVIR